MPKGVYNRKPIEERLLESCLRCDTTGCFLYTGHLDRYGYGQISQDGKTRSVHKIAWELKNGPVPDGMEVCHTCDEKYPIDSKENRRCCEITHLYLGTRKENAERMSQLGRWKGGAKPGDGMGEANGNCKLSDEDYEEILRIRREHDKKVKPYMELYAELAVAYGVSVITIQKIVGGKLKR